MNKKEIFKVILLSLSLAYVVTKAVLQEYDEAAEFLNAVTERKQKAENQLKELLGANEVGICGNRMISWKTTVQERLDCKLLKAEHPELFKQYLNQISFRKFTVKAV